LVGGEGGDAEGIDDAPKALSRKDAESVDGGGEGEEVYADYGVPMSILSSPIGVRVEPWPKTDFSAFQVSQNASR